MIINRSSNNNDNDKPLQLVTLPPTRKVSASHLQNNGKLYSDDVIGKLQGIISKEGKVGKKSDLLRNDSELAHLAKKFSLLKITDTNGKKRLIAIYDGAKQEKEIGKGSFGSVKYGQDLESGEWYAIKVIRPAKDVTDNVHNKDTEYPESVGSKIIHEDVDDEAIKEKLKNDLQALGETTQEADEYQMLVNVDQAMGQLLQVPSESKKTKTGDQVKQKFIVMKLAKGVSLGDYLDERASMSLQESLTIITSLLQSFKEFHDKDFIHRDIKPQNMIYNPHAKHTTIIDLGFAKKLEGGKALSLVASGTIGYAEPGIEELFNVVGKNATERLSVWQDKWDEWQRQTVNMVKRTGDENLLTQWRKFLNEGRYIFEKTITDNMLNAADAKALEERKNNWLKLGMHLSQITISQDDKESKVWQDGIRQFMERAQWDKQREQGYFSFSKGSDVYALGSSILEILEKVNPNELNQYQELLTLAKACLHKDVNMRPTVTELLNTYQAYENKLFPNQNEGKAKTIGVVDCTGLTAASINSTLKAKWQLYDEIILVKDKTVSLQQMAEIKYALEQQGISVAQHCVMKNDMDQQTVIAKLRAATTEKVIYAPAYHNNYNPRQTTRELGIARFEASKTVLAHASQTITKTGDILRKLQEERRERVDQHNTRKKQGIENNNHVKGKDDHESKLASAAQIPQPAAQAKQPVAQVAQPAAVVQEPATLRRFKP